MGWLFPWLLFAHVLGSFLAFGPTFAYGTYAKLAAQQGGPARSFNDAARSLVNRQMVLPGTFVVLITGILLIWVVSYPWTHPSARWLQLAIVLYLGMIAWNMAVSRRRQERIVTLMAEARATALAEGPPPPPSPEVLDLIAKVRRDGKAMGWVVLAILFLMVVKPQLGV